MRTLVRKLWTAAVLLAGACQQPAIDPSDSLVGAKELPPAEALSNEIIWIGRGFGKYPNPGLLSYELRPDDTLTIALTAPDFKTIEGKENFRLSPQIASQTRHALWRLRPEKLRGIEWATWPAGCPQPPLDSMPDFSVAFSAEGSKPGVDDDQMEAFVLPHESNCRSRQAVEARKLIQTVIRSFPASKVAARFEERLVR